MRHQTWGGSLLEIDKNLEFGPLLEVRGSTGDLRGCRKVYVDKVTPEKPRFRIVYWCSPDERRPRRARILAVGPRKDLAVYTSAARRYNPDRASVRQAPVESRTDADLGLDVHD